MVGIEGYCNEYKLKHLFRVEKWETDKQQGKDLVWRFTDVYSNFTFVVLAITSSQHESFALTRRNIGCYYPLAFRDPILDSCLEITRSVTLPPRLSP